MYDYNKKPSHDYDYVLKMKNHEHAHEVCRRVRPRNSGWQIEVEFADHTTAIVPRQMVKSISSRRPA